MAPSGLVITKLGVQATASEDLVRGLLCLKISLPKESEGRTGARWALFNSSPPRLLSQPAIYPLPLPLPSSRSGPLRIASTLLSLPAPTSYPPASPPDLGGKPYIDVSGTTGKVYVVVDPVTTVRRGSNRSGGSSGSGVGGSSPENRKDWLIVMDFEISVEGDIDESLSKVLIPVPKCLDNVIRFQIATPSSSSSSSSSEIRILTEPKILSLPQTAFKTHHVSQTRRRSHSKGRGKGKEVRKMDGEEDWEDGEDLGPDGIPSDESDLDDAVSDSDSDDEGGSWLEGKFKRFSTDVLRLEWSFSPSPGLDLPFLRLTPIWDHRQPSIRLQYTTQINSDDSIVALEIDVPDGWGWSDFSIQGEGLTFWRSTDGDWWDAALEQTVDPDATIELQAYDDSFATVRAKRNRLVSPSSNSGLSYLPTLAHSQSSASLMRQTFPAPLDMKVEDYSFELGSMEQIATPAPRPNTPVESRRSPATQDSLFMNSRNPKMSHPIPGKAFDLMFDGSDDRGITVSGVLVPLSSLTLVSPSLPIRIPFVTLGDAGSESCLVQCHSANYGNGTHSRANHRHTCDIALGGSFAWSDSQGDPLRQSGKKAVIVKGDVKVKLRKNVWGNITMSVRFPLPRGDEAGFTIFGVTDREVRMVKASMGGVALPRCVHDWGKGKVEVRIGKKEGKDSGTVEVVVEMSPQGSDWGLPSFDGGSGVAHVELCGEGWEGVYMNGPGCSVTPTPDFPNVYTYNLATSTPITLKVLPASTSSFNAVRQERRERGRRLFSFSTFLNLLLLWMLVSMFQQIQRLRNEVAFVVDETRDLRLYGFGDDHSHVKAFDVPHADRSSGQRQDENVRTKQDSAIGDVGPSIAKDLLKLASGATGTRSADGSLVESHQPKDHALGRVVFGQGGWQKWTIHPTVRTLSKSVAWLWHTVVRLIVPLG
ncbi:hypothetical protein IAR55_003257 [Kwoniella newhampshirensis]|uniref:Uncharacterized protein n=1 Tax=Kwoniella newhampshirensis TaxID=1651941 RepID=A0AAW0YWM6_9TREE